MASTIHCDKCSKKKSPKAEAQWISLFFNGSLDYNEKVPRHADLCPACGKLLAPIITKFLKQK